MQYSGPPKVARVHSLSALTISLTPENRCLLSPLSFYQIPLQELFFLKWSSAFLYCLFFLMQPLPLALNFNSFLVLSWIFPLYLWSRFFKIYLSIPSLFIFWNAPPFLCFHFQLISHFVLLDFFLYTYGRVSLKCISAFCLNINPLPPPLPFRPVPSFCTSFWSQI